ncbi:MAG: hypothetical protein Q8L15_05975 [Methylobacter sp.]|nr:hypothetical protein [Methylobacter sp.]
MNTIRTELICPRWFITLAISFVLICLPIPALAAPPQAPANTATPLLKEEFDAIVVEAKRHMRQEDPVGKDWYSLDREKLARLLSMPEFAALDDDIKPPLIDQAGAWELMPFESPSEALAMWARWYPEKNIGKPVTRDTRNMVISPVSFHADEKWADEAGAMIALLNCLPPPYWAVYHEEPLLWAMETNAVGLPNGLDFGMCVRKQKEELGSSPWPSLPDTKRGKTSANVLEKKLSAYLLQHRCSRKGADNCLLLLHSLLSLNQRPEQLVAILKTLEPEFALTDEVKIPDTFQGKAGSLSTEEFETLQTIRRVILRKAIFLTAKLPVLLQTGEKWPHDELEKDMRLLINLTVTLEQMDVIQAGLSPNLKLGVRDFVDPWATLDRGKAMEPALPRLLNKLGQEYAQTIDCDLAQHVYNNLPLQFWYAYALEKIEHEQTSCSVMPYQWIAQVYAKAVQQKQPKLLEPIQGLRKFIQSKGQSAIRDEIVTHLGANCAKIKTPAARDPWKICEARVKNLK